MYSIIYTKQSKENLSQIFSYISEDNYENAGIAIYSLKQTIDILKIFPLSGREINEYNRMIVNSKYRYKIIYKINGKKVFIVSIFKYKNLF